jgi:hypothetical protein
MLRMFARMPALEHVAVRGGLAMTMRDHVFPEDPHAVRWSPKTKGYCYVNPPVLENVFPILVTSIRTLDLSTCMNGLGQLVHDFVAVVHQGKLDKLERLSIGYTLRRMTRVEGEAFLEVLPLCGALALLEVGCCSACLYVWQQRTLDALGARCPGLVIDRERGSRLKS